MPLCPQQIPNDLAWARTRDAAVGSWRPTAGTMARPCTRAFLNAHYSPRLENRAATVVPEYLLLFCCRMLRVRFALASVARFVTEMNTGILGHVVGHACGYEGLGEYFPTC
jgi:hypothetical protein